MKMLRWAAVALLAFLSAPAIAATTVPPCINAGGNFFPCQGAMPVDHNAAELFTPDNPGNTKAVPGENIIGHTPGLSGLASGTLTRPANTTAYASGQMVGNSTTAGASTPITLAGASRVAGITGASPSTIGSTGTITGLRLSKTGSGITNASFRVHLFRTLPTLTGADGAALAGTVNGIAAVHIGYVDVTLDQAFTDGAKGEAAPARGPIIFTTAGSTSLYAVIEARAAYTPTSAETFTVTAEIAQD